MIFNINNSIEIQTILIQVAIPTLDRHSSMVKFAIQI